MQLPQPNNVNFIRGLSSLISGTGFRGTFWYMCIGGLEGGMITRYVHLSMLLVSCQQDSASQARRDKDLPERGFEFRALGFRMHG